MSRTSTLSSDMPNSFNLTRWGQRDSDGGLTHQREPVACRVKRGIIRVGIGFARNTGPGWGQGQGPRGKRAVGLGNPTLRGVLEDKGDAGVDAVKPAEQP